MGLPWPQAAAGGLLLVLAAGAAAPPGSPASVLAALALLCVLRFAAWAVWSTFVYPRWLSPLRHLPQPGGAHWLLGHGPRIINESPGTSAREWITELSHDGLIRYLWFFNRERIIVASPKALAEVLVTKPYVFKKPDMVKLIVGRILGLGVLLAEGDEHKVQRRKLLPAFGFRRVKDLHPIFWSKAREAVQAMTAACDGQGRLALEVGPWASRCTLDIIGAAGLGHEFGAIRDGDHALVRTYGQLARPSWQAKLLKALMLLLPGAWLNWLPLKRNRELDEASIQIRHVCRQLVAEKRRKKDAGEAMTETDILSVALESGHFSDEGLVDQLMTFLAAGHETTASALTWAIYHLARNPEMQRRLRDEVRQRLPCLDEAQGELASRLVDEMPYLKAVCSEALRIHSPVPQTVREAVEDTTIQGQPIRRGTRIVLAPWGTNVDQRLWGADASRFRPDRWLAGPESAEAGAATGGASSRFAFITFLHGPRSCIGQSFARAELACLLAAWVGRFDFALRDTALAADECVQVQQTGLTARPADGLPVWATLVDGWS